MFIGFHVTVARVRFAAEEAGVEPSCLHLRQDARPTRLAQLTEVHTVALLEDAGADVGGGEQIGHRGRHRHPKGE
jgi:hypothetical protein